MCKKYNLFDFFRYSTTAFNNGLNLKTISNLYEAFIGGIYQVFGINGAIYVADKTLKKSFKLEILQDHSHPKNLLQELFQKSSKNNVEYETVALPNGFFGSSVSFEGKIYGEGYGKTKKEAETDAATNALEKLGK
ncbi:putative dsRNA-binding protein [Metamycoplasma gateae]|uniref:DsRNA-binding protein n=1 Tax=Metamycoplasma gateae TaxID=35769 RepID=A0ABZ2AHS9_9BACT|nr:putative dsRNA-binding protein [Metamycoplasma gateae]